MTEAAEDTVLSPDERRHLIEKVSARVKDKKKVLVSISAVSTREAVDLTRHAEAQGASGILLSLYRLPGLGYREIYRHLDRVAAASALPVYLTVRSENAVDALTPEEADTMAQHAGLSGIYLPEGGAQLTKAWARRIQANKPVFVGSAFGFLGASKNGATAAICGLTVLAVEAVARMSEAMARGDTESLRYLERFEKAVAPALELLGPPLPPEELDGLKKFATRLAQRPLNGSSLLPAVPAGLIKESLKLQGHPVSSFVRPPTEQVSAKSIERLKLVLKSSGLLT